MGRRASNDSAETFDRIVATATRILSESGASQLTLRRVASETGLRLGTVQYYFASKDALVERVLSEHSAALQERLDVVRAALTAGADLEEVLVAGVRALYRQRGDERETYRLRVLWSVASEGQSGQGLVLLREMQQTARLLQEHGIGELESRFLVHSISVLLTRYAIHPEAELRTLLGVAEGFGVHEAVEEHLAAATRALVRDARARSAAPPTSKRTGPG